MKVHDAVADAVLAEQFKPKTNVIAGAGSPPGRSGDGWGTRGIQRPTSRFLARRHARRAVQTRTPVRQVIETADAMQSTRATYPVPLDNKTTLATAFIAVAPRPRRR